MILVTGANGFVGHKIMEMCKDPVAAPSLRDKSYEDIYRIVEESDAEVIVHTAAISDTGACQADPTTSYHANVEIPVWLAKAAKKRKLICFSSDQVYNGCEEDGPYTETDATPASVYAEHKLLMEQRVLDILPEAVMLRAEWMYDYYPARPNYFMNVINASESLSVSFRQFRGLTYLREVAENMHSIFALPGGSYNFGSETSKTMYEITVEFLDYLGKDIKLVDTSLRHNLWMNCDKAKQYGVSFSDVSQGLIKCARDYGYGQV